MLRRIRMERKVTGGALEGAPLMESLAPVGCNAPAVRLRQPAAVCRFP